MSQGSDLEKQDKEAAEKARKRLGYKSEENFVDPYLPTEIVERVKSKSFKHGFIEALAYERERQYRTRKRSENMKQAGGEFRDRIQVFQGTQYVLMAQSELDRMIKGYDDEIQALKQAPPAVSDEVLQNEVEAVLNFIDKIGMTSGPLVQVYNTLQSALRNIERSNNEMLEKD